MTASIIIYMDRTISTFVERQIEFAAACWPWIVVVAIGVGIAGFGLYKIVSALLDAKARELAKPAPEE